MYDDYCKEVIDADFFKSRSEKIQERQEEIKDRLSELEEERDYFDKKIGKSIEVLDAMKNWDKIFEKASDEKKNHLLRLLTIKISTVHNKAERNGKVYEYRGLEFTYSPEVRELFEIGILEKDKEWHDSNSSGNWGQNNSLIAEKLSMSAAPLRIPPRPNPAFKNRSSRVAIWIFTYCRRACIEHGVKGHHQSGRYGRWQR